MVVQTTSGGYVVLLLCNTQFASLYRQAAAENYANGIGSAGGTRRTWRADRHDAVKATPETLVGREKLDSGSQYLIFRAVIVYNLA